MIPYTDMSDLSATAQINLTSRRFQLENQLTSRLEAIETEYRRDVRAAKTIRDEAIDRTKTDHRFDVNALALDIARLQLAAASTDEQE